MQLRNPALENGCTQAIYNADSIQRHCDIILEPRGPVDEKS
jgi:hypothetical protein